MRSDIISSTKIFSLASGFMVNGLGFRVQGARPPANEGGLRGRFHSVDYEPFETLEIHVVRDQNCITNSLKVIFFWENRLFERGL